MVNAANGGWWVDSMDKRDEIVARGSKLEEVDT